MNREKKCNICNKIFIGNQHNQKYCSEKCFAEGRKLRRKNCKKFSLLCEFCNKNFITAKKTTKFCSRSCSSKNSFKQGKYKEWHEKGLKINKSKKSDQGHYCLVCNKEYFTKKKEDKRTKTCSVACRIKYVSSLNKIKNKKSTEIFIRDARDVHGSKYDYSLVDYEKAHSKIKIICNKHGIFTQTANNHLRPRNCPSCVQHVSSGQKYLYDILKTRLPNETIKLESNIDNIEKFYKADILFPERKIIVEYNGTYWHADPEKYSFDFFIKRKNMTAKQIWIYDKERNQFLKDNGFKVFIVWEREFQKNKKRAIENLLAEIQKNLKE